MNNLYIYDRLARVIIAIVLVYLSGVGFNLYIIVGLMLLATASVGYCPIYRLMNINMSFERKNRLLTKLPKSNPEPVFIFSSNGELNFQNESSKEILPELQNFKDLSQEDPKQVILNEKKSNTKYNYKDKIYMVEYIGVKNESYILAYGFNITDIVKSQDKLKKQTITDVLTGLGNRTKLLEDIENFEKDELSLLVFDVIKFSQINSFFGHKKGDEFLKQFALEIENFIQALRYSTYAYRLRGNTFALLVDFKDNKNSIEDIRDALFTLFENITLKVNDITTTVEIRVGVASKCTKEGEKFLCTSLLNNAETALSEAKKETLAYLHFRDIKDINDRYKENIEWVNRLHNLFSDKPKDSLKAYFQPIYNLHTKKIEKFEALVRIEDGEKVISPFKFLDIAKQINFLPKITDAVLTQALHTFKDTSFEFSINITTQDLKDKKFLNELCKKIEESDMNISSIVLEILEDEDMYEYINTISELKSKGFKLAIDDFGTGYSNFQKLQQLNVDYIKIDGSLVKNIAKNPKDLQIIQSICNYAQAIGVKTIAEFVADREIYELIKTSGVDYAQGYYVGQPNPNIEVDFRDN